MVCRVPSGDQPQYQQINLATDVHIISIVVVRTVVGAEPQRPQSLKPADFLKWAKRQKDLAKELLAGICLCALRVISVWG